jgi:hypothetical protein
MTSKAMKEILSRLRTTPWVVVVMIAALSAAMFPIWPNGHGGYTTMIGYVLSWAGASFKAMSGGVLGFLFCRHVLRVNLSEIYDPLARSIAGLGCAIVIGAFIVGICVAV